MAYYLSVAGGVLVVLGGVDVAVRTSMLGLAGLLWGALIIVLAFMLNSKPENHKTYGMLILVFSCLSWFGAAGGLIIGFILGLIGGALAVMW